MKTIFLALAIVAAALASNSANFVDTTLNGGTFPNSGTPFTNLSDVHWEGQVTMSLGQGNDKGIVSWDSAEQIHINSTDVLIWNGVGFASNAAFDLTRLKVVGGLVSFRFSADRCATGIGTNCTGVSTGVLTVIDEYGGGQYFGSTTFSGGNLDRSATRFFLGQMYSGHSGVFKFGMLRGYSSVPVVAGAYIPLRFRTSGKGDLFDFEFENNTTDDAGNYTISLPGMTYSTTTAIAPSVSVTAPQTLISGQTVTLSNVAFTNGDSAGLTYVWSVGSGPSTPTLGTATAATTTFANAAGLFGQYACTLAVTDSSSQTTTVNFAIGSVIADANGVVNVLAESGNAGITQIIGPLIANGSNPWAWADPAVKVAFDNLRRMRDLGGNGTGAGFIDIWNTASTHGTFTATYGSKTLVGSAGTQAQTDFCGGGTTPFNQPVIALWYPHPDYPGQFGRAFFVVTGCPDQHTVTIPYEFAHAGSGGSVFTGLQYTALAGLDLYPWEKSNIPGNYYDSLVTASYKKYYSTGLTSYRDDARTMALRWWTGPNWDMGATWNTNRVGGCCIIAGPARGTALMGLVLWSLEQATVDIWPGAVHLMDYFDYNVNTFAPPYQQLGDIRETAYMTGDLALCVLYSTNLTYKNGVCSTALTNALNGGWKTYRMAPGYWAVPVAGINFSASDGSVYVSTVNGSTTATLTGTNWTPNLFDSGCCGTPYDQYVWFTNDKKMVVPPQVSTVSAAANTNAQGDSVAYRVTNVPSLFTGNVDASGTTATASGGATPWVANALIGYDIYFGGIGYNITGNTSSVLTLASSVNTPITPVTGAAYVIYSKTLTLDRAYTGTNGQHGMQVANFVAWGLQPYMQGLALGQMAKFVYPASLASGHSADATMVLGWISTGIKWLAANVFFNTGTYGTSGTYGGALFATCTTYGQVGPCSPAVSQTEELTAGMSSIYSLTLDPAILTIGDAMYQSLWAKTGFAAPFTPNGTWLFDIDPTVNGYMIGAQPDTNKWVGFCCGVGDEPGWPAARLSQPLMITIGINRGGSPRGIERGR
jgi:K319-like protein